MNSKKNSLKNTETTTLDGQTFRLIFEGHSAVMLLIDPERGDILDANQAAVDFYGYPKLKLCSMKIGEINTLPPEQVAAETQKVLKGKRNYFVFSHRLASGEERIVEIHSSPITLQKKQVLFSIVHDITERKKTEDLFEKIRKNYETFFNSIDDFLFVLDDKGNILHTNNTVRDRLGYSKEELSEKSVLLVHPPERREEAGRIVGEMLAGSAEFCPVPLMTKSGERIPVETRVAPGFWDGKPAIFGVTKDMSQIKLSEEKFSKIFQSNSVLMALSYLESGVFIDVNDVFLKTLGFSRDEVIGTTSKDIHLFADADQRNKIIEEMKQNGVVKDIEVSVRTKDGSLRHGLFSADTIYIGKDPCLLTVMVDITERERAEEALRESQLLYHSLVEGSPLSICRKDLAGRFTFANQRFLELSHTTLADLVGKTDFDLHPSALAEKYRRDDQAVLESKQVQELIEERVVLGGESVIVQSIKAPIYDGSGKIKGIQISFWDITDRKRATDALRESEISLNRAQSIAHVGSWNLDVRRNIAVWSAETYRIFECPSETPLNYEAFLTHVHPDDVDFLNQSWQSALQGAPCDVEHRILTANGKVKWVRERAEMESDAEGNVLRAIGTVQDITERRQMEEALRESEEKYRTVADFTYDWEAWHAPDGAYLYISPSCERISGYTAAQFLADANLMVKITHPDDQSMVSEHLYAVIHHSTEQDSQLDFRIVTLGGEIRWINHHCTAVYSKSGQWLGRRESNRDITIRKLAEGRILQIANELQGTLDTVTAGISHITNRKVEWANAAYDEMFGYSIGETRGMETALLYPDRASFERLGQEAYPQLWAGKTYTTEMEMLKKNGTRFWCNLTGRALNVAQPAEGSIWMSRDITERKQVEAELHRSNVALSAAHQELQKSYLLEKQLARTDMLTGINNRGYLFELAAREFNVAMRYQLSFSIIMFDIDYFKRINDSFGHLMGDLVLQKVTQAVCAEIRSADLIGRYGGDEFIVLMPQTTAQEALPLAERIHASVATLRIATDKDLLTVTISIGIAQMEYTAVPEPGLADSVEGLFLRADKALYKAKQAGRNRTVIFD